jgi:hypothetical protein
MTSNLSSSSLDAAKLALLGLRSNLASGSLPASLVYRIATEGRSVTQQDLLEALAGAQKPVTCFAEVVDGVLNVTWHPLADSPYEFDFHRRCLDDERSGRGFAGFLLNHYGGTPQTLQVFCVGKDDSFVLPLQVVEQWRADYSGFAFSADVVDNPHAVHDPAYVNARSLGAVGVLRFAPPGRAEVSISITLEPPRQGEDPQEAARRCVRDASDVRSLLPTFIESPQLGLLMDDYADQCRRFFGAGLPRELTTVLSEWEAFKRGPAA